MIGYSYYYYWICVAVPGLVFCSSGLAQVTFSDSFNSPVNYLSNGVAGTVWDGVYFGAGDFANSGLGSGGAGSTLQCDANITAANYGTISSAGASREIQFALKYIF